MLAINTQTQSTQPNFQGRLIVTGIKLPKRKLAQVARIFEEKTQGLPDVVIQGETAKSSKGKFYHITNFILRRGLNNIIEVKNKSSKNASKSTLEFVGGTKYGKMLTTDFKETFHLMSAQEFATELVKTTKWANGKYEREESIRNLEKKLTKLITRNEKINSKIQANKDGKYPNFAKVYEIMAKVIERDIAAIQAKIRIIQNKDSNIGPLNRNLFGSIYKRPIIGKMEISIKN